jgi:hypothetical protein
VGVQLEEAKDPACANKAILAGQKWFVAQEGDIPQVKGGSLQTNVSVTCDPSTNQVTATVTYSGLIVTNFGHLVPKAWPSWPYWGMTGITTAVISVPSYVEVMMLLDNSSSMLIATDETNIKALEQLTPCSTQSATAGQLIDYNYSWAYKPTGVTYFTNPPVSAYSDQLAPKAVPKTIAIPYGYGSFVYPTAKGPVAVNDIPPPPTQVGKCDQNFHGPADECLYPTTLLASGLAVKGQSVNTNGQCTVNGIVSPKNGGPGSVMNYKNPITGVTTPTPPNTVTRTSMPQAPCAFACHYAQPATPGDPSSSPDYFGLALSNNVSLRYKIVQAAAANVITTMLHQTNQNQLSVGVYQFNAPGTANSQPLGIQQVYPEPPKVGEAFDPPEKGVSNEAGLVSQNAEKLTADVLPPVTTDYPDTDFEDAMSNLAQNVTAAGGGTSPAAPRKNLFIVTDGMDDYKGSSGRVEGPINPAACDQFKNPAVPADPSQPAGLGYTVYVLYIRYYPLPNPWYLNQGARKAAEPYGSSSIEQALTNCASTGDYFTAEGDKKSIDTALQAMLQKALNEPGTFTQ